MRRNAPDRTPRLARPAAVTAVLAALVGCGADTPADWDPLATGPTTPPATLPSAAVAGERGDGSGTDEASGAASGSDRLAVTDAGPGHLDGLLESMFLPVEPVDVGFEIVTARESAVDLAFRPGEVLPHVVEHAGRVVRLADGEVVADLRDRLLDHDNEQGLTGLEFSADGSTAWIHYTRPSGATTISEVPLDAEGRFLLDAERPLIELGDPPGIHHNSGDLLLAPDGTLLITLGDGDAAIRAAEGNTPTDDPHRVAHDPSTLRGSILRVRPTPDGPRPYEIPDDNPFASGPLVGPDGEPVAGAPEVFAWGLRNPWKIDLDEATGTLWVADVGSQASEEINAVAPSGGRPAGWAADFGWSAFEGTTPRNDDVTPVLGDPIDPVYEYPHDLGRCAISGGVVYRGESLPTLWSGYVFADFCQGAVWVYDLTSGEATRLVGGVPGISAVRAGPDGELWVLRWFGDVLRLVPV